MKELPTLGFVEAIKLASSRILDFKGRSRRSEFWWWMLVVIVAGWILDMFTSNLLVNAITSIISMFFGLAATARRLHDSGKSALWVYISYALGCLFNLYFSTSTTMNKLMEEASYGSISQHAMEKIVENGMGEMACIGLLSFIHGLMALIVFIMCLFDSKPEPNQYGESPKYINETEA
ncbi:MULTISPECIES: DUF805 domain-containing protein [unclassified Prevotella]|uniref:DUF805 domain-containing protein n=1 Tax=unclassified Prevotella TaxID=2638335 RepID=UPI00048E597D|nr:MULTISPECIES: DUF805 domain-containing protein [unclassified Prevotella]